MKLRYIGKFRSVFIPDAKAHVERGGEFKVKEKVGRELLKQKNNFEEVKPPPVSDGSESSIQS